MFDEASIDQNLLMPDGYNDFETNAGLASLTIDVSDEDAFRADARIYAPGGPQVEWMLVAASPSRSFSLKSERTPSS